MIFISSLQISDLFLKVFFFRCTSICMLFLVSFLYHALGHCPSCPIVDLSQLTAPTYSIKTIRVCVLSSKKRATTHPPDLYPLHANCTD